ncbi:hypothetical protein BX616_002371, partial [Lobosporangium transversale]
KNQKVAHFIKVDVTNPNEQAEMFQAAEKYFGRVDIIVNNAGIAELTPLWEDEKGTWRRVLDVDLIAVIEGTRLGIQALKKHGQGGRGGVIINTASLAGIYPQSYVPAYSAAKSGVIALTRSFKNFGDNIRVNAVAPSFSETKIFPAFEEAFKALGETFNPVERVIDAFMMLIEDDSYRGDVLRVTPQYGITVLDRRGKAKL